MGRIQNGNDGTDDERKMDDGNDGNDENDENESDAYGIHDGNDACENQNGDVY
jgi:hypothetical protein